MYVVAVGGGGGLVATATVIFVCLFIISIKRSFYDFTGREPEGPAWNVVGIKTSCFSHK